MKLLASSTLMLGLIVIALVGCAQTPKVAVTENQTNNTIASIGRSPVAAGTYYPNDKQTLSEVISGIMTEARNSSENGTIRMLMVPHSSYVYSGKVMGNGYNQIKDEYNKVIIIADAPKGVKGIFVVNQDYNTPLGLVQVDKESVEKLLHTVRIENRKDNRASIEVQLPFLQKRLTDFKIVPILIGEQSPNALNMISDMITNITDNKTLIIISSGMSYGSPYIDTYKKDTPCLTAINKLNINGVIKCQFTDYQAVLVGLQVGIMQELKPDMINYMTSGDTAGGLDKVEAYAAVAFREKQKEE